MISIEKQRATVLKQLDKLHKQFMKISLFLMKLNKMKPEKKSKRKLNRRK